MIMDETLAVRTGLAASYHHEHSEGLFLTSSFIFENAEQAAQRFSGEVPGTIYSRFTNPTVSIFEKRLAVLENGEWCIATASGMSAIMTAFLGTLREGDHVIASQSIFGTSFVLFQQIFARFGITTSFVSLADIQNWKAEIRSNTKLFFLETPSNPLMVLVDLQKLCELARDHNIITVVDNCFCTPVLQKPLDFGADVVIHSATKYLDGQGRCLGGAIVGRSEEFFKDIYSVLRSGGASLSPFNAWVMLKGLETLSIRMERHCSNALEMASFLTNQPKIKKVYYTGLPSHPQHDLANVQQKGFGGVVSFLLEGGKDNAWKFIDSLNIFSITANLGDAKSTVTHPATTTHARLTSGERLSSGIEDGLIRFSVGLEHIEDLKQDVQQALDQLN